MKQNFQLQAAAENCWMNLIVYNLHQEVRFDMVKVIKGSHLVKLKVAFLKSTKNAAGIGPFFYGAKVN